MSKVFTRRFVGRVLYAGSAALLPNVASAQGWAPGIGQLVDSVESQYNNIFVYRSGPIFTMTFGHNRRIFTESVYDSRDPRLLPVEYTRFMTTAVAYVRNPSSILQIGLGGGRTSWYLHLHMAEATIEVAEIDPAVVDLAQKYFGIRPNTRFHIEAVDGRLYITRSRMNYDMILIDAYRGPFVPFHLLTREFYQLVSSRLKPGGIVAQNVEPSTMVFDGAIATMRAVFRQVDMFPAGGNVVIVGYNADQRIPQSTLHEQAAILQRQYQFRHPLPELVAGRRVLAESVQSKVLTDDFAPVEAMRAIERYNRKWE